MKAVGRYDSALQMFVEETREPNKRHLEFLQWLVKNGRLRQDTTVSLSAEAEGSSRGSSRLGGEGSEINRSGHPFAGGYFPTTAEGIPRLNRAEMGGIARERGV